MAVLHDLGLGKALAERLVEAGIKTVEKLASWNRRELDSIPGVGDKSLDRIEEALGEVGLALTDDPLSPYECVREGRAAWDVRLCSFHLCEACVAEWTVGAFRGEPPVFDATVLSGSCQNCTQVASDLHLAQWLLCGNCERVARSIGRSIAAEMYVATRFEEAFRQSLLELEQLDQPVLRAHDAQILEQKTPSIDFMIHEEGTPIAGIELKTGRSHLGGWAPVGAKMATFQLDHGDCDDISEVATSDGIVVYLFHAQVIDRAEPPTTRFEAVGLWWIDPFSFSESYQTSRTRPRETKTAAYYSTDRFRPFEEFEEHWRSGEMASVRQRFGQHGQPPLYR
ncbi:MAG: helix-hairpin-helix domain-containing protein [bacterium]|nr:helix-hairpin-helix domain-containing protein [bacterium]MDE0216773.1 helix-hairpin-helix domain-containing protein [bacterium]